MSSMSEINLNPGHHSQDGMSKSTPDTKEEEQYQIKYIIGDKFYAFAQSSHVISVSEFFYRMKKEESFSKSHEIYYFGQGVSELEKELINKFCLKNGITIFQNGELADTALTHKLKQENIMITAPIKISENTFQSQLKINDECAEMSDHVTGQHIQGMVLIEAARQMMLAVSEKYVLGRENVTG